MMQTPARWQKRGTARGHALFNPPHQLARRQSARISSGGREFRPAHQAKPAHEGAHVATRTCSTRRHQRAYAPAAAAAGPPAPAAEMSSRTTEKARWKRHRAPRERATHGERDPSAARRRAQLRGDLTSSGWEAENENPRFCGNGVGDVHTGPRPIDRRDYRLVAGDCSPLRQAIGVNRVTNAVAHAA
jgi:hypothetical protein